jgi:hypothetical protein
MRIRLPNGKYLGARLLLLRSDWTANSWLLQLQCSYHDRHTFVWGAGYIGNRTAYLGRNVKDGHRLLRWAFGAPRAANSIPCLPF